MRVVTLSGWGQPADALAAFGPGIDYGSGGSLAAIAAQIGDADVAIGWSLGGQLLVRTVAAGLAAPKKLVLIAAAFQFVENGSLALGMKRDLYATFRANYARNPARTLGKAWELIAKGDAHAECVTAVMAAQDKQAVLTHDWLSWLDWLEGFSCVGLDFSGFPPTVLMHGEQDAVASPAQSQAFAARLPGAKLLLLEGCGHAPHWHDPDWVRAHAGL